MARMSDAIQQSVWLDAASDESFDAYLDPIRHAEITGQPVKISAKSGARFSAFDAQLAGRNLLIVPKSLIVQAWRSTNWNSDDLDSVRMLRFSPERGGTRIELAHIGVPAHDHQGVTEGWNKYYWKPWRRWLAKNKK